MRQRTCQLVPRLTRKRGQRGRCRVKIEQLTLWARRDYKSMPTARRESCTRLVQSSRLHQGFRAGDNPAQWDCEVCAVCAVCAVGKKHFFWQEPCCDWRNTNPKRAATNVLLVGTKRFSCGMWTSPASISRQASGKSFSGCRRHMFSESRVPVQSVMTGARISAQARTRALNRRKPSLRMRTSGWIKLKVPDTAANFNLWSANSRRI